MPVEKRRYPRSPVVWPVTLMGLDGLVSGVTRNLSLAGTLVHRSEKPIISDKLSLVFKPSDRQLLPAAAEMVWSKTFIRSETKTYAMGVCFTHIPDPGRQLLSEMVCNYLKLEYMKQFFAKRLRFWGLTIFNKMKLHQFKCQRCKTDLLLGPNEKKCSVCEAELPKSMNFS